MIGACEALSLFLSDIEKKFSATRRSREGYVRGYRKNLPSLER